jgi:hypothetical protein
MKMRGGADATLAPAAAADAVAKVADAPAMGGRRHRKSARKSKGRGLFGMRY